MGSHHNRLDAKGRVSIPAPFRNELKAEAGGAALVLRPSHNHPCIEGWPAAAFAELSASLDQIDVFSAEREDLAMALYADAYSVEPDKEGRIVLPDSLIDHAGLTDAVVFTGAGKTFLIWEPAAAERRRQEARERARARSTPGTRPAPPPAPAPTGGAA